MAKVFQLSKSALRAQSTRLAASAHNVANLNTAGFRPLRVGLQSLGAGYGVMAQVEQTPGEAPLPVLPDERALLGYNGVDLANEQITQLSAQRAYEANLQVVKAEDALWKALLEADDAT